MTDEREAMNITDTRTTAAGFATSTPPQPPQPTDDTPKKEEDA